jgi:hypothetical protein
MEKVCFAAFLEAICIDYFRDSLTHWLSDSWTCWFVHDNERWRTSEVTRSESGNCDCFGNNCVIPQSVRV